VVSKSRRLASELVALVLLGGCGEAEPRAVPEPVVVQTREVGPLRFVPAIRGRDGGYSAAFGGASVWTFGDTVLETASEDGGRWRSSTWCATPDLDASDGLSGLDEPLDKAGAPGEFLPFTEEETAFNREHNREELGEKRQRYALWPGPIVVDPATGGALVFYGKLLCGAGAWDFTLVGHSLARWPRPDAARERPLVAPGSAEPTLLFSKDEILLGQGAFAEDGWVYAYGVQSRGLSWPCVLARVRFADALEKGRWEYWAGEEGWSRDPANAREIMQAAPQMSVHRNAFLGGYVAFYGLPLENGIAMRTAPRPEGPWSEARRVHEGLAPLEKDAWNYCGIGHAELQREGGRLEYLTYYRTTGFLQGEIRLVEVRFGATDPR
jgi:hypothetical protein